MGDRSADRPIQQCRERAGSASQLPDISELATRLLGPDRAAALNRAAAGSGMQRLQGVEAYEQEAARLQALAQEAEQHLWNCSAHREQARVRYEQLQTTKGATGAVAYDLEQAQQDMESLTYVMIQVREDYLALMHRASQHLAAAAILRGEEHE